jgi:ribosomal protein L24
MRNLKIYLVGLACLFVSSLFAQKSFENRTIEIASKIESVVKTEKEKLKIKVEEVNVELSENKITSEQADKKKKELAEASAIVIEEQVAVLENELHAIVQDKVDGKIKYTEKDSSTTISINFSKDYFKNKKRAKGEKRTTSQFVFALGANNLVTNEQVAHSDFYYWKSHFYEWGFTSNTRILADDNLLHFKYGMSLMYNNLRATDNRYFEKNGPQTNLVTSAINLDESRFRNVYIMVPMHLEFDFTKKETREDGNYFRTHKSWRVGLGGYAGFRIKSKQLFCFDDANGNDVEQKIKGNYNVNDFNYGLSTYVGYKATSLYLKYDLQPLFENNSVDQNNISLGLRFDFN